MVDFDTASLEVVATSESNWIVLSPRRSPIPWQELWQRRELQAFLVWRELKIRYKQTAVGALWAVFQPLVAMAIFSVIFGRVVAVDTGDIPYASFALTGLIGWIYFANALAQASNSLIDNQALLSKVYFPRLMLPVAPVLAGLIDLAIGTTLLLAVVLTHQNPFTVRLLVLPLAIAMISLTAFGVGLILSALNVHFRDVKYVVPFMLQVWMFSSPVVYPASAIPEVWRPIYALNPISTAMSLFRWSVLGSSIPPLSAIATSVVMIAVVLIAGQWVFNRAENTFADVI